jgi:quercetin dioxygenase-like cupin family protein
MLVQVIPWSGAEPPTADLIAARMHSEGLRPSAWSNGPGDRYSVHQHTYHKVLYCVSGSIRFTLREDSAAAGVDLTPGDRMELPAGTLHGAIVGPQGCHCIEAAR